MGSVFEQDPATSFEVTAASKLPPSPASSPHDVLAEFLNSSRAASPATPPAAIGATLAAENAALKLQLAELRASHEALRAERDAEKSGVDDARLALVRSLLDPLERLELLIPFEEARCAESPMLPALAANVARFHRALGEHGLQQITPAAGEAFDGALH